MQFSLGVFDTVPAGMETFAAICRGTADPGITVDDQTLTAAASNDANAWTALLVACGVGKPAVPPMVRDIQAGRGEMFREAARDIAMKRPTRAQAKARMGQATAQWRKAGGGAAIPTPIPVIGPPPTQQMMPGVAVVATDRLQPPATFTSMAPPGAPPEVAPGDVVAQVTQALPSGEDALAQAQIAAQAAAQAAVDAAQAATPFVDQAGAAVKSRTGVSPLVWLAGGFLLWKWLSK